ncbi:outer membrane receptor protein involved in Fe transport [Mucilaginibacter oryzae]|uniref:Outer membrane receptor protein involved in Fe transport n=1 Tax=Mucilaginibacter oryzae TaxID=468058 RepID=A0A316H063_9SPHI|nr:outer membrane beta-barrel protein [Mucilaginibacter oryzae]PWK70838.1 outer membrane receptor protein involved in Fe transport [Mucilaginibacter oryzae]
MNISAKLRKKGRLCDLLFAWKIQNKQIICQLMRISVLITFIILSSIQLLLANSAKGQNMNSDQVTLGLDNESLLTGLKKIEGQTTLRFYYRKEDIKTLTELNLPNRKRTIAQTLEELLKNTSLSFRQIGDNILLERSGMDINYQIKGRIVDVNHKPIAYTTVSIVKPELGRVIQSTHTDTMGVYNLTVQEAGAYLLNVTQVGMDSLSIPLTISNRKVLQLPDITVTISTKQLDQVTVIAKIPPIENRGDRYVVNVSNSTMATSSSLQLLKVLPFVRVTPAKEVKLEDKNTLILLDGRPVPGVATSDILDNLKVNDIEKIELITQPSAKYDANYGAVINIITKKRQTVGFTGNLIGDDSQGIYNSGSVSANVTYKSEKFTITGRTSYGHTNEYYLDDNNRVESSGPVIQRLQDSTRRLYKNNNYSVQLGADYKLNSDQTLGIQIYGRLNHTPGNFDAMAKFRSVSVVPDSIVRTNSLFKNDGYTFNYNINYHLLTDSAKNDLSMLFTYTPYKLTLNQSAFPKLYDGEGAFEKDISPYQTYGRSLVKIYIGQADYVRKFNGNQTLEAGGKFQNTDSHNLQSYSVSEMTSVNSIAGYTTNTDLRETIIAGYGIYSKNWKKDNLSFGMRIENTTTSGFSLKNYNYINYFPNAKWNHQYNNDYSLSLSYGKFINRPPYQELLPYKVVTDQYTIMQGNINLKPSYDHTFTGNVRIKNLNVSLEYTHTTAPFFQLPVDEDAGNQITTFAFENLNSANKFSLNTYYSLDIFKWWNLGQSISTGHNSASGTVLSGRSSLNSYFFIANNSQTFNFSKKIKFALNAYYVSAGNVGLTKLKAYGNLDASAIFNISSKLQFTLSGEEILKRLKYHSMSDYGLLNSEVYTSSDSRRIRVGLIYSFGKSQIKDVKKKLGNDDATGRL